MSHVTKPSAEPIGVTEGFSCFSSSWIREYTICYFWAAKRWGKQSGRLYRQNVNLESS